VEDEQFLDYMQVVDLAVNLRSPSGGESSGSLIRLLGLAKPVLVSACGSFEELPDGCCVKVAMDGSEEKTLLAYMLELAKDPDTRTRIGAEGRRYVEREHSLKAAASGYRDAIFDFIEFAPSLPLQKRRQVPTIAEGIMAELNADLSAALVELGVEEEDDETLREIAKDLMSLGLA
jgi:hypothetical protein